MVSQQFFCVPNQKSSIDLELSEDNPQFLSVPQAHSCEMG